MKHASKARGHDPIEPTHVRTLLTSTPPPEPARLHAILDKARALEPLSLQEVAALLAVDREEGRNAVRATAQGVKEEIYGRRMVLFAPLYVANHCVNNCLYCAFRTGNRALLRRALTRTEVEQQVHELLRQGHKRVLLVSGEGYPSEGFDYILNTLDTIYRTRVGADSIRRVNVNVAPLEDHQYRALKERGIGTYQVFQETYDHERYRAVHTRGPKADFHRRLQAPAEAMAAGLDDIGIGALFGLADWRFEVLSLLQHARSLEAEFGCGPHTISVPRLEPAVGSPLASQPPAPVSDADFLLLIAILRLAVPYTGLIISTREPPELRRETLALGISQLSAGSCTEPGGYGHAAPESAQFTLGDHRPLDEVVRELAESGYLPSFCTACYRLGRTGADFMDLARPGEIKRHCLPNGLATFQEYLCDFASPATRAAGEALIEQRLAALDPELARPTRHMVALVRAGRRDVYC